MPAGLLPASRHGRSPTGSPAHPCIAFPPLQPLGADGGSSRQPQQQAQAQTSVAVPAIQDPPHRLAVGCRPQCQLRLQAARIGKPLELPALAGEPLLLQPRTAPTPPPRPLAHGAPASSPDAPRPRTLLLPKPHPPGGVYAHRAGGPQPRQGLLPFRHHLQPVLFQVKGAGAVVAGTCASASGGKPPARVPWRFAGALALPG